MGSDLSSAALILKAARFRWYFQTERAPCLGPLSVHRFSSFVLVAQPMSENLSWGPI